MSRSTRAFGRDAGLRRAAIVLGAYLAILHGRAIVLGEPIARTDIFCDDALWVGSCGRPVPEARQNDFSPALLNYPYESWNAHEIRRGHVPGWNPRVGLGAPTPLTFQGSAPNPLRLPFYLLPNAQMHNLSLVGQLFFAGLFTFLLARRLGAGDEGGLLAALIYPSCGYLAGYTAFSIAASAAVLPALLYGSECLASERTATAMLGTGLAFALGATVGHPSTNFLTPQAGAVYMGARIVGLVLTGQRVAAGRALLLSLGALGICVAVAAASWVGFLELLGQGYTYKTEVRGEKVLETARLQARQLKWVTFLTPRAFFDFYLRFKAVSPFPHFALPYVGISTLALALYALVTRRTPVVLAVLLAFGIAVTYGPGPLSKIQKLPGYDKIYYYYCLYLLAMPLAIYAGLGLAAVLRRGWHGALVVALIAAAVIAVGVSRLGHAQLPKHTSAWRTFVSQEIRTPLGVRIYFRHALLFVGVATALAFAASARRKAGGAALTGAAVLEILWNTSFLREPAIAFNFEPSPAVAFLQDKTAEGEARWGPGSVRITGTDWRSPMINGASAAGLLDLRQTDALQIGRYTTYMKALDPHNEKNFPTFRVTTRYNSPLLDLAGVRFIARERGGPNATNYWRSRRGFVAPFGAPATELDNDRERPLAFTGEGIAVYENRRAVPRAFLVQSYFVAATNETAVIETRKLAHPGFGPRTVRSSVVLEPLGAERPPPLRPEAPAFDEPGLDLLGDEAPPVGKAKFLRDTVDVQTIATESPAPSYLVVTDTFYSGWQARVDGRRATIFPADIAFRAVAVPSGKHVVEFSYRPTWRYVAAFVSLPAFVAACVAWVVLVLRRRRLRESAGVPSLAIVP